MSLVVRDLIHNGQFSSQSKCKIYSLLSLYIYCTLLYMDKCIESHRIISAESRNFHIDEVGD